MNDSDNPNTHPLYLDMQPCDRMVGMGVVSYVARIPDTRYAKQRNQRDVSSPSSSSMRLCPSTSLHLSQNNVLEDYGQMKDDGACALPHSDHLHHHVVKTKPSIYTSAEVMNSVNNPGIMYHYEALHHLPA